MSVPAAAALIPAYQAAATIGDVVQRTQAIVGAVFVVDDGSADGTADAARRAGATVWSHPANLGKGAALRTGWSRLRGDAWPIVLTLDADGQHLPEQLPRLLDAARTADLVLGSRAHLFADMSRIRRMANVLSSKAISLAAGQRFDDVQTGFRAYRREVLERVGFRENGFQAESAIVVRAARLGLRIRCVPVEMAAMDGRSTSHYRPLLDSVRIVCAVTAARFDFRSLQTP